MKFFYCYSCSQWATPKKIPIVEGLGFHLTSPSTAGTKRKMISICGVSPTFPNAESDREHQNPFQRDCLSSLFFGRKETDNKSLFF